MGSEDRTYTEEELSLRIKEERRIWEHQDKLKKLEERLNSHDGRFDEHEERITAIETNDSIIKHQVHEIHEKLVVVDNKPKKFWENYQRFVQGAGGTVSLIVLIGGGIVWLVLFFNTPKVQTTEVSPKTEATK